MMVVRCVDRRLANDRDYEADFQSQPVALQGYGWVFSSRSQGTVVPAPQLMCIDKSSDFLWWGVLASYTQQHL